MTRRHPSGKKRKRAFWAEAHRLGSIGCVQGAVQRRERELVGDYLARLAGARLGPEGLSGPRSVFTSWRVRLTPWQL